MTAKRFNGPVALVIFLALISTGATLSSAQCVGCPGARQDPTAPPPNSTTVGMNNMGKPAVKANKAEEDAYKALTARTASQSAQIPLGEDFVRKFPDSRYLPSVYGILTSAYFAAGNEDKMFVSGSKALELNPDNADVLALLAMAMPRRVRSNTPDAAQQLEKAEGYARHAMELIPALPKPADVDDATFEKAKNEQLSMAHSGMGLIDINRKKYTDARAELLLAVQLAANPDPVDYYLLGNADVQTSYYNDAVTAYEKCAASGPLAAECKSREESAKQDAAASLSR